MNTNSKADSEQKRNSLLEKVAAFVATGGFIFTKLPAPGTMASIVAIVPTFYLAQYQWYFSFPFVVLLFVISIYICKYAEYSLGKDHSGIIIDEVVAVLLLAPLIQLPLEPAFYVVFFVSWVFFRIFDIFKPWPISVVQDRVKGGLGVMLDDVIAVLPSLGIIFLFNTL